MSNLFSTFKEYASIKGISQKTVYRWLKNNDIEGKKIKGQWHVKVNDNNTDKDELILTLKSKNDQLESQNEYLQDRLQQAQDTIDNMQEKHDEAQQQSNMIVMQLTNQLAVLFTSRSVQKTLALEDKSRIIDEMQNRSLWRRLKTALSTAS